MGGHLTGIFSFRSGAVRLSDLGYILCSSDDADPEMPHTAVFIWDAGEWAAEQLSWTAHSTTVVKVPKEQMVALGVNGEIFITGSGDLRIEEKIYRSGPPMDKSGDFREVREIGGYAYAVGMFGQVYRRDGVNQWSRRDQGLPSDGRSEADLESIHGFSEDDMYAVGWKGGIWHFDGHLWSQVNSPTNLLLTKVLCAPDGNVYACGQCGMLLRGRGNRWEVIEQVVTETDFWSMAWFQDKLYLSTTQFLYTLEGNELEIVDFDEDIPETCYHLSTADGVLWSIGAKDVMAFDGKQWTRID